MKYCQTTLLARTHLAVLDHQVAGESLGVALGDEAALVRRHGEDAGRLEGAQLAGGAGRAVDLQLLARPADLLPVELRQRLAKDLRQAQPQLAPNAASQSGHYYRVLRMPVKR